jgi:hypothetical protein
MFMHEESRYSERGGRRAEIKKLVSQCQGYFIFRYNREIKNQAPLLKGTGLRDIFQIF